MPDLDLHQLAADIKVWGRELGFQQVGITDIDLRDAEVRALYSAMRRILREAIARHAREAELPKAYLYVQVQNKPLKPIPFRPGGTPVPTAE